MWPMGTHKEYMMLCKKTHKALWVKPTTRFFTSLRIPSWQTARRAGKPNGWPFFFTWNQPLMRHQPTREHHVVQRCCNVVDHARWGPSDSSGYLRILSFCQVHLVDCRLPCFLHLAAHAFVGKLNLWEVPLKGDDFRNTTEVPGDEADVPFTAGVPGESGFQVPTARGVRNV